MRVCVCVWFVAKRKALEERLLSVLRYVFWHLCMCVSIYVCIVRCQTQGAGREITERTKVRCFGIYVCVCVCVCVWFVAKRRALEERLQSVLTYVVLATCVHIQPNNF